MKRGTPDHPKTIMLTMELEKVYAAHRKKSSFGGKTEAVGILEVLWHWASKYAIQGDVGKWPDDVIAASIGWTFSGKELISALIVSHWLDEVPAPHRLVIHDIKDHATNAWRQNLEDAGLTWWDGSPPRKYSIKKTPEKLQNTSRKSPQPKPQPKPEPKPEPEAALPPDTTTLPDDFEPLYARHPIKRDRGIAMQYYSQIQGIEDPVVREHIDAAHARWCKSSRWAPGKFCGAGTLAQWLLDRGYDYEPPEEPESHGRESSHGHLPPEVQRILAEANRGGAQ